MDIYGKLKNNLEILEKEHNLKIRDICKNKEDHKNLTLFLKETADKYNLQIESCAEQNLEQYGINKGKCIDGDLIEKLFSNNTIHKKDRNQRTECGCMKSVDLGVYDSCNFDCVYCYANTSNPSKRKLNTKKHKPFNDFII